MTTSVELMRGFVVDFFNRHDTSARSQLMAADHLLCVGDLRIAGRDDPVNAGGAAAVRPVPGFGDDRAWTRRRRRPDRAALLRARRDDLFVRVVFDLQVPRMAFRRACVLGDSAFVARPHAAAGTAKAAENAWALRDALHASPKRSCGCARRMGA